MNHAEQLLEKLRKFRATTAAIPRVQPMITWMKNNGMIVSKPLAVEEDDTKAASIMAATPSRVTNEIVQLKRFLSQKH